MRWQNQDRYQEKNCKIVAGNKQSPPSPAVLFIFSRPTSHLHSHRFIFSVSFLENGGYRMRRYENVKIEN